MAQHRQFTIDSGIQVYFSVHAKEKLDAIAEELNNPPRRTLSWMTPLEKFAEVVAMTG
jgi:IS30 family transposase